MGEFLQACEHTDETPLTFTELLSGSRNANNGAIAGEASVQHGGHGNAVRKGKLETLRQKKCISDINPLTFTELLYADDTALITNNLHAMSRLIAKIEEHACRRPG